MISSPLTIINPLHFPSSPFFLGTHYSNVYFYFCKSKSAKLRQRYKSSHSLNGWVSTGSWHLNIWQDAVYECHIGQHWRRVPALVATQEICARTVRKDYAAFQHKVALEALRHCHHSHSAIPLFSLTPSHKLSGHSSGLSMSFSNSTRYRYLKKTVRFEPLQAAAG